MKIEGHALGAWFNHERFNQRKAKGYTLSKRFDHRLSRLLSRLLFKLLPPAWYLRTQGIKLYREPRATATVTYKLHGEVKTRQVEFGSARALVKTFPLWFEHGFCEPAPELSPYIPPHLDDRGYYIPPIHVLKVEWYDPILKDSISIDRPSWRLDEHDRRHSGNHNPHL